MAALPAAAQVKADLGASAVSAPGGPAGAVTSLTGGSAGVAPLSPLGVAPLAGAPSLSAAALPASALAPVPAAADGPRAAPQKAAAAPASPPAGPPSAAAPPGPPSAPFLAALRRLGAPGPAVDRLEFFLMTRHPGDQGRVYHGLAHTYEVADAAAQVVAGQDLPDDRKALIVLAAALKSVDPDRLPDTPARAAATLEHLDGDDEARAVLAQFTGRFGFTADQVKALIAAADSGASAAAAFPGEDFGAVWGRRLAFLEKTAPFLSGAATAERRVLGLAHERGEDGARLLAGTAESLSGLRRDPDYALLPAARRADFERVAAYFEARRTPDAWTAESAPAPARAPPDVAAARRYVKSIASGIGLDAKQTDGILTIFFEEHGIPPGSERAEAVRRALVPSRAAADDAAVRGLSPALAPRRATLLRLAAKHGTTPPAIERTLARRGVLGRISGLDDEGFELQADRALTRDELERAVAGYPRNAQGEFLRAVAGAMATPSGKSVEEVARDGVFGYVDFSGDKVVRAWAGRDPDLKQAHMVFYITRNEAEGGGARWRIGGYRQNAALRRGDDALVRALRTWLTAGGIPAADLE